MRPDERQRSWAGAFRRLRGLAGPTPRPERPGSCRSCSRLSLGRSSESRRIPPRAPEGQVRPRTRARPPRTLRPGPMVLGEAATTRGRLRARSNRRLQCAGRGRWPPPASDGRRQAAASYPRCSAGERLAATRQWRHGLHRSELRAIATRQASAGRTRGRGNGLVRGLLASFSRGFSRGAVDKMVPGRGVRSPERSGRQ